MAKGDGGDGKGKPRVDGDTEVTTTGLASILGITGRRVQQLGQDGTIKPVRRGVYELGDAVQRYLTYLRNREITDDEVTAAEKKKLVSNARRAEAQATIAELEAEEVKGNMHRADDVEIITNDMIYTLRSALIAFPGRIAVDLVNIESAAEAANIVRREIHKLMRELAEYSYDAAKYEERVRERRDWKPAEDGRNLTDGEE